MNSNGSEFETDFPKREQARVTQASQKFKILCIRGHYQKETEKDNSQNGAKFSDHMSDKFKP